MLKKIFDKIISYFGFKIIKLKTFKNLKDIHTYETDKKNAPKFNLDTFDEKNPLVHLKHFDYRGKFQNVSNLNLDQLITLRCSFNQLERANVIFAACSSLFKGDYFEFGCNRLNSFITTLNLVHVYDIENIWKEKKQFYGFDLFGDLNFDEPVSKKIINKNISYFKGFQNDLKLNDYYKFIKENGLNYDNCILVKGLINKTFTDDFINEYLKTGRKAGFVYIDLNIASSYLDVFKKLPKILRKDAFIYVDEYLEQPEVTALSEKFRRILFEEYDLNTIVARECGGWGVLFRCYDKNILDNKDELKLVHN